MRGLGGELEADWQGRTERAGGSWDQERGERSGGFPERETVEILSR